MRKFFLFFSLSAIVIFINAQQLTYVSRAIGNSTHMGKGPHMQNHIQDMVVDGDGTCRTFSVWDEGGHSMGVYKDGAFLYNGNLPQGSSRSVVDNSGKTWTINNFYGRFLDATKNCWPDFRTDPVPTGSNKPTITCSDGRTITSIADPVALGINRSNGQLLVADNGTDQNIKVFNISGTPSQIGTFGKQGGVWGDSIPGRTSDMLRFRGVTGVGGDNSGNIYVSMDGYPGIEGSGGGAEIRAFNPDGTLRWRMVGFIFVSTGHVDPATDGADIYTGYHHFKMDYSKPQGFNSDWSQYSISINPFLYPNDPRLVTSTEDPHAIKIINGRKYMFLTDMYHNMLWVYRFDGEIAVPCAAFCAHFGWNGDEYIRNIWNYTRGRPVITANGQHWLWTDLNGDGSGENQSNEYAFFNVTRFIKGIDVDNDGNVYLSSADNGNIYKFPTNGFDSNGNPQYSASTMTVFANVGHGAYSMKWVQENDMFVVGNGEDITTVDIWQNWSSSSRSKVRSVTMPEHPEGDARSVTADQDYFYMNYLLAGGPYTGKQGEIDVYKMSDGSFVGYIIPGPEIGSVSGQNDMASPVNVFVTSTGKRLIINQEDEVGKVLVYEWTPSGSAPTQSPYGGTARTIPGIIQAEDFDTGGQGVAYNDNESANQGGQYRTTEGVDIEVCSEGGYNVGWIDAGEWMEYTVNVTSGTYSIILRVSAPNSNKQAKIYLDGTLLGTFTIPNTGSWQTWQTVTVNNVVLSGGNDKILKIESVTDGFNINSIEFVATTVAVTSVSVNPTTATISVGNTQQLTETVLPTNATNKTVNWSSSNTAVATVNTSGLVTGVAAGSATITVTTQDGAETATSSVIVTDVSGNLALNKTVTANSYESTGLEASNTVDGNTSTRWGSSMGVNPNPEWIYVDLEAVYAINRVKLTWEAAYGKSYQIQVSPDASTWTTIYNTTTGDGGVDDLTNLSGTGRYVRMYATERGLGGGFSIYEFEVYGAVVTTNAIYEAEDATYGGGAEFWDEDPGYSGTGFVRNFYSTGQYVEFAITGATAGTQNVTLRYTTGIAGSLHLYVNGSMIRKLTIPTTGGWSNWQDYVVNVTLNAGNNTIKFQHDADDTGYYYLDCLTVTGIISGTDENMVVFMGNSITQSWSSIHPAFFANKPYINKGISGQTTSQMLARFEDDVVALSPAVVVILGGTNDIAGNGGPTTVNNIFDNIASMAQLAKTNGIQVVLCSVLPVYRYSWSPEVNPIDSIISLNSLIKAYAEDNEMIYADFYSPLVNEDMGLKSQFSGDGVHPNLAGYEVMEPIVEEAISISLVGDLPTNEPAFAYRSHTNSSIANYSMPYRLFVPSGYNSNNSYPIVLFLHGAGERGTDNEAQLNANRGATLWAENANQAAYPSFVVAPQCPSDKQWVNTNWSNGSYSINNIPMSTELQMVKDIIETLQTQYNIDASRIFITGLSMGGYGTWDFILRYPTMFKAAIPICGAGDPSKASLIGTLPLRVFHSSDDGVVPVSGSRDMVNAINALGTNDRNPFYTEYTDQGHFSWVNAYNTADLVSWMFTTPPIMITTSLRDPENPANVVNGLDYKYYEGTWSVLPDFTSLTPVASGTVTNVDSTPKLQSDNFGFQFTGFINVPNDGNYIFYTSSDDGSKLYIGSTLVVNNDGLHSSAEVGSTIGLKAGIHAIRVDFFEATGDDVLEVRYEGPNLTKQLIPASALYRVASSTQLPYGGVSRTIPGTIQAEDFDTGGQGVAYNDNESANQGGQYRTTEGVDIEVCSEGGYNVGWIDAGEWMEYTVNANAGTYDINLNVSSPNSNKQANIYLDGILLGTFAIPNTGSWQTWQTVTINNVSISGGSGKVLKIECVTDGFNINSIQFIAATGATIYEAENAIYGGGAEFRDEDPGFSGTGFVRNFNSTGQFVEFSITGAAAGAQNVTLRYTTGIAGSLHLYVNGSMISKLTIPTTGGWSNWQDYVVNVTLNAGNNTIKFQHDADDTGYYYIDCLSLGGGQQNVKKQFEVLDNETESDISLIPNPLSSGSLSIKLPDGSVHLTILDMTGKIVYLEQVTKNEYLIDQNVFKSGGIYVINVQTKHNTLNRKLIVTK